MTQILNILCAILAISTSGCGDSKFTQNGEQFGTFSSMGRGFTEEISILAGDQATYLHAVSIGGIEVCRETGKVKFNGNTLILSNFTEFIDDKTGTPRASPVKCVEFWLYFLKGPPFDSLKPLPENDYFLRRKKMD